MAEWDYGGFWKKTIDQLRAEVGDQEFGILFTNLEYMRGEEHSIFVRVPSSFLRDQIKKRYQSTIIGILSKMIGRDIALNFEIESGRNPDSSSFQAEPITSINTSETKNSTEAPKTEKSQPIASEKKEKPKRLDLLKEYTFDKYIISEFNSFAANAAIAISKNPGKSYNPFFVYGGVGLGKTHLMHAIGNYVYKNSDSKVICVTSEDFLNEYVEGTQQGKMGVFKNKFRLTDVLLIDDIQFFSGKEGVQEELFHTFNALISAKKQVVFTSDRPPFELKKFSERLLSRFEQGLKVDLQPPRYEDRCAILKSTAEARNVTIPNEVIDLVAKNISSNIRDLKGALETLIAYMEILERPLTLEIAQQKLRDELASNRQANISIEIIQKVIAEQYNISPNDLKGIKRTKKIVFPRQLSMYIAREITEFSTTELGESFGGRDHSTVLHSISKIEADLKTEAGLEFQIENLKRLIKEAIAKS